MYISHLNIIGRCKKGEKTTMNGINRLFAVVVFSSKYSYKSYFKIPIRYKQTKSFAQHKYWRFKSNVSKQQIYDYFLVLDFEATCVENNKLPIQEIIEFPCLKINGMTMEIESVFHQYVQPKVFPKLSYFCTQLTGITQEMVDGQCDFKATLEKFDTWLIGQGVDNEKSVFVTSGDWDLQVLLPTQCRNENITVPTCMTSWINIKQSFADSTGHFPRGITSMMQKLKLESRGRLHSGIDDCRNLALILKALDSKGHVFHKTGFTTSFIS